MGPVSASAVPLTVAGRPCQFPFFYRGEAHTQCVPYSAADTSAFCQDVDGGFSMCSPATTGGYAQPVSWLNQWAGQGQLEMQAREHPQEPPETFAAPAPRNPPPPPLLGVRLLHGACPHLAGRAVGARLAWHEVRQADKEHGRCSRLRLTAVRASCVRAAGRDRQRGGAVLHQRDGRRAHRHRRRPAVLLEGLRVRAPVARRD